MKLIDLKEKEFEISYRVPSMAVQDKFADINTKLMRKLAEIKNANPELENVDFENGKVDIDKLAVGLEVANEIRKINNEALINMFKVMIKENKLTGEHQELIKTDVGSEFWSNQNILDITNEVNSFRVGLGL